MEISASEKKIMLKTLSGEEGIPWLLLTSQGVCSEDAMEGWFRVDGMCVGRLVYSGGSV